MDYGQAKNEVSKEIKKRLIAAGLKEVSVRGGRGTAWGWIELWRSPSFTPEEREKIKEVLGLDVGLSNCHPDTIKSWAAILGRADFKKNPKAHALEELKAKFYELAKTFDDNGTCCGGSGLYIFENGLRVDFWENHIAQSTGPIWEAQQAMLEEFAAAGFETKLESGWMD